MTLWTIPAGQPFLDVLVEGIFTRLGHDPLALAELQIILPTRRAVRSLREAFLRATGGGVMLLPRIGALGDIDGDELELALPDSAGEQLDLPPAIPPLRRDMLLAQLIRRSHGVLPGQALALAGDLAALIDQVHTERSSFERLESLVPAELAEHWQITIDFLKIVSHAWPDELARAGMLDPADRRNRLIAAQIEAWRRRPPAAPLIAAGLASTIPALSDLIAAILALPAGQVVLNGLDSDADDAIWQAAGADPTHPQHGIARLLDRLSIDRASMPEWPTSRRAIPSAVSRAGLVREIMRPAAVSEFWRSLAPLGIGATDGMTRIDLAGAHEEAQTIALLMRDRLDLPGATAMLITPDRSLARRVAAELRRWDIEIDDSAGRPLGRTPPGAFLRLIADAVAEELAPVPLLALLKHPLAACGLEPAACRERVRGFEIGRLRGPRPAPGLAGLRAVAGTDDAAAGLVERIASALEAFAILAAAPEASLADLLHAHIVAAESLAATDVTPGAERLWAGEAGEAAAQFIAEFAAAATETAPVGGADYPMLFEAALAGRVVRPVAGRHPRLQILGTLEARLQSADLVIIGGLNEGTWPPESAADPFLSRPMRAQFGLAPAEITVGVAAHDFAMALSAPEIVLTRALRVEGTPTVPSRWLLRLETVLRALQLDTLPLGGRGYHGFRAYQALLDRPDRVRAAPPPAPRPPVAARPRDLPVTAIELWMRDPYGLYAQRILELQALEPLDADPSVAERGAFIHRALERFLNERGGVPVAEWSDLLVRLGRDAFGEALLHPGVRTFWWPRFLKLSEWVIETEFARLPTILEARPERRGRIMLAGPAGPFTLRATADRIETLASGGLAIIDYKTGPPPGAKEVAAGLAPQLPLEALIAEAGGFAGVAAARVEELAFWYLSGTRIAGAACPLEEIGTLIANARAGLLRLIDRFDDPATPYHSQPSAAAAPRYSDYGHLARVKEWSFTGEE